MIDKLLKSIPHNAHYLTRYIRLVSIWQQQNLATIDLIERHHICPRAMFPEYKDGRRYTWNIVKLTPRQHFLAHWVLWKAYTNKTCAFAFKMMVGCQRSNPTRKVSSHVYAQLKEKTSTKGIPKTLEHCKKISIARTGIIKHSDATKKRLSEVARNRSPETREAIGLKHRGKNISPQMREQLSVALSGQKNPRALIWTIEWEDGRIEQIKSLKSWCVTNDLKYTTIYMRLRNGDNKIFRDGFRVLGKFSS